MEEGKLTMDRRSKIPLISVLSSVESIRATDCVNKINAGAVKIGNRERIRKTELFIVRWFLPT